MNYGLLALYGALWAGFSLTGAAVAVTLAANAEGVLGAVLLLTVGVAAVAAGPVAARGVMTRILDEREAATHG